MAPALLIIGDHEVQLAAVVAAFDQPVTAGQGTRCGEKITATGIIVTLLPRNRSRRVNSPPPARQQRLRSPSRPQGTVHASTRRQRCDTPPDPPPQTCIQDRSRPADASPSHLQTQDHQKCETWATYDDALIRNDNAGYWIQGPWVDTNPSNGGIIVVSGFSDSPVGTSICKYGVKTNWPAGPSPPRTRRVTFDGTNTVHGLTRHSACVEKGDSGGANYRVSGNSAEGVTSGAVLYGATLRCGQAVGQPTISWYFPIADSLAYYGPKYGVTVW
jgi:hypothetical protein